MSYIVEASQIESKKADLVWNTIALEQYLEDDNNLGACDTILKIVDIIDGIITITKRSPDVLKLPDVTKSFKIILEFSNQLDSIVRSRSWFTTCPTFSPKKSLDDVKILRGIFKKANKKPVRERKVKIVESAIITPPEDNYIEKLREIRKRSGKRFKYAQELSKDINTKALNIDNLFL